MVVVNPGMILNKTSNEPEQEISCIIYFDSLMHTFKTLEKHGKNIRSWLNEEYKLSPNSDATFEIKTEMLNIYDPQSKIIDNSVYKCVYVLVSHFLHPCTLISE